MSIIYWPNLGYNDDTGYYSSTVDDTTRGWSYDYLEGVAAVYKGTDFWPLAEEGFAVQNARREYPFVVRDRLIALYLLDSYDFNPPPTTPSTAPAIATNPYGPIDDVEDEPFLDPAYLVAGAADPGYFDVDITQFLSAGASVSALGAAGRSAAGAVAAIGQSRNIADGGGRDWRQATGPVEGFGSSYSTYVAGDSFVLNDPDPPTELTEVVVVARQNDEPFYGFPGFASNTVAPIIVVAGGGSGKAPAPKIYLRTPAYLVSIGVLRIPPISPKDYAYIFSKHGPAGLAQNKTVYLDQYLNPATMNFLMASTIQGGQVVDVNARGYIAVVWQAPAQIGTNRFGDALTINRVILAPVGGGSYVVVNSYPVGDRR